MRIPFLNMFYRLLENGNPMPHLFNIGTFTVTVPFMTFAINGVPIPNTAHIVFQKL